MPSLSGAWEDGVTVRSGSPSVSPDTAAGGSRPCLPVGWSPTLDLPQEQSSSPPTAPSAQPACASPCWPCGVAAYSALVTPEGCHLYHPRGVSTCGKPGKELFPSHPRSLRPHEHRAQGRARTSIPTVAVHHEPIRVGEGEVGSSPGEAWGTGQGYILWRA